ncbi:hypothetical protein [Chenggangzhangella methanolivorans]|uniref:Uncharacterized protein n=1 Tax=Chenggangzhangella methanolivorans TaxID=1437009 RepID=A0A9E6R893_9HYPH|nr:hypothetical protein [Chenggangzhangella methanolivorans]QZN99649.1 hypothetical protein K6K41_23620 [Chenggangzhangella methanolivorans]
MAYPTERPNPAHKGLPGFAALKAAMAVADARAEDDDRPKVPADAPSLDLWSLAAAGGPPTIVGLCDLGLVTVVEVDCWSEGAPGRPAWARCTNGTLVRLLRPAPLPLSPETRP